MVAVVGFGSRRRAVAFLAPFASIPVGVGTSDAATLGSIRSPELPRWFGPPLLPSVALGVGSSDCSTTSCSVTE